MAGKRKKKAGAKKVGRKGKKTGGKTGGKTQAALLAKIAALEAQLAAKNAGVVAVDGSIAAGTATQSVLLSNSQIKGDVYLGAPTEEQREAVAIYRRVFISSNRHVFLGGILQPSVDGKAGDGRPELAQVYVALDTKSVEPKDIGRKWPADLSAPKETKPISALAATIRNRRIVLLGEPGSGKSTFVAHLGLCLAAHSLHPKGGWLKRLPGWPKAEADLLPICVVLRDFARWVSLREHAGPADPSQLWDYLVKQLERQRLGFAAKAIEKALEKGKAILILDGLDEIPGRDDVCRVRGAVQAFVGRYADCRVIATCRTASYRTGNSTLDGLPDFELARFDDEKIDRFVAAWYAELGRLGIVRSEEEKSKTESLRRAVRQKDIGRLVPNPLLLTVVATFHAHKGELPDQRAQLYEQTIELLLWTWERVRSSDSDEQPPLRHLLNQAGVTESDLYRVLAGRAFLVQGQGGGDEEKAVDIAEADLERDLSCLHPEKSKDWAGKVIEAIRLRAGLLIEREEGIFCFPHRTFQEYLAGAHLAGRSNFATEALELAKSNLALYHEVLLLAAGKSAHVSKEIERPVHLAGVLCPAEMNDDEQSWRLVILAGEVLVEIGVSAACGCAGGEDLCKRVRGRLVILIEEERLPARDRAIAGDVLAAIGDPRFRDASEWSLPKDEMFGFVEIPAGPFAMGSATFHAGWQDIPEVPEMPEHKVCLPGFLMARFPVTVAQYRSFMQAADAKLKDEEGLKSPATRPMTYVSLDEALAYCAWLDQELRARLDLPAVLRQALDWGKVTIPSEAEWEKAARGSEGRIYPWGSEWNPERANVDETGILATSAVGCFRLGKSPFDCEDMSGNIFEWTRSRQNSHPYPAEPKERARRKAQDRDHHSVVRGGCFLFDQGGAHATYRNIYRPSGRNDLIGFRVAVSPSVSDHKLPAEKS